MAGRPFLRADYRIRCYEDEWNAFTPIVLLVLFGFTAALPTFIGFYLWRNRAELYSTRVYQTVGFLYAACECSVFVFFLSPRSQLFFPSVSESDPMPAANPSTKTTAAPSSGSCTTSSSR